MFDVGDFWENILSGESARILAAFNSLPLDEQVAVFEHLQEMATGSGWAEVQRESAQAALAVLTPPES